MHQLLAFIELSEQRAYFIDSDEIEVLQFRSGRERGELIKIGTYHRVAGP